MVVVGMMVVILMMMMMMMMSSMAEGEEVRYCKVISAINWKKQPLIVDFKVGRAVVLYDVL